MLQLHTDTKVPAGPLLICVIFQVEGVASGRSQGYKHMVHHFLLKGIPTFKGIVKTNGSLQHQEESPSQDTPDNSCEVAHQGCCPLTACLHILYRPLRVFIYKPFQIIFLCLILFLLFLLATALCLMASFPPHQPQCQERTRRPAETQTCQCCKADQSRSPQDVLLGFSRELLHLLLQPNPLLFLELRMRLHAQMCHLIQTMTRRPWVLDEALQERKTRVPRNPWSAAKWTKGLEWRWGRGSWQ